MTFDSPQTAKLIATDVANSTDNYYFFTILRFLSHKLIHKYAWVGHHCLYEALSIQFKPPFTDTHARHTGAKQHTDKSSQFDSSPHELQLTDRYSASRYSRHRHLEFYEIHRALINKYVSTWSVRVCFNRFFRWLFNGTLRILVKEERIVMFIFCFSRNFYRY